ncbi:hypothetical protein [Ancylomarina longa]|uniref:Tetratricopeptide repeat protein n=1 Tax=Ancylomarina longa TaxID=2487017 RepID=A0A434AUE5_9BACT|nr:hypothetical protein [Ancylomarina longa]RUT77957.1 hypothetical protein DLK05_10790 [Ancylomarina longa]
MSKFIILFFLLFNFFYSNAQIKELQKLYSKGEFDLVIQKGRSMVLNEETELGINLLIGRAYADKKKFGDAIPYLERANSIKSIKNESKTWVLAYLGVCYFTFDEIEKAHQLIQQSIDLHGSRKVTKFAQRYRYLFQNTSFYSDWEVESSEHFRFHLQNSKIAGNLNIYMAKQEVLYKRLTTFFEYKLTKKIDIYIWADKYEAYRKLKRPLNYSNTDLCIINVSDDENMDFELCHLFVNKIIKPKKRSMLLNEGLAVYINNMDKNLFLLARKSIPKKKFNVLELWEEPTRYERNLSYPVGGALIEFLINKGGKAKLQKFLEEQTIENAEAIYPNFDQWMKTFEAMLMR